MKRHLAIIFAGVAAVVALAGCAVLYQTGTRTEAALQETTAALDGVRLENQSLKEEIAAAQKTLDDLRIAQEERAAAREAQEQKERELQKQQEIEKVESPTTPPSGGSGSTGDKWDNLPPGQDPFGNTPQGGNYIDGSGGNWK